MASVTTAIFIVMLATSQSSNEQNSSWYRGDEYCQPPADNGTYSAPYNALEHRSEYPTFHGADKPGWSCSYQRADGVIVQFGDSRSPRQQWLDTWGGNDN